jgi:uncharacterized membrane protein YoaK (UPF0700 family)
MSSQNPPPEIARRVDPNAERVLHRPFFMVLVLAAVGGALDADDYLTYGVFTANQAGNMVLLWIKILDEPGEALLSLSSLIGCALGIAFAVVLRSFKRWPVGERGSRALLFAAAGILAVTSLIGGRLFDLRVNISASTLELGSSGWWGAFFSVSMSAFSLGVLATVFIWAGTQKTAVIAATGPYLDAARYATASIIYKAPEYRAKWRALIAFPVAWTLGAMFVGLTPFDRPVITLIAVLTVLSVAVFARPREPQSGPAD